MSGVRFTKESGGYKATLPRKAKRKGRDPNKPVERKAYSLRETVNLLGVSMDTIRRLLRTKELRSVRLTPRGNHLIPAVEIDRILAGGNCK